MTQSLVLKPATAEQIAMFKLGAASVYKAAGISGKEADARFNAQLTKIAQEMAGVKDLTMEQALEAGQPAETPKKEGPDSGSAKADMPKMDVAPVTEEGKKSKCATKCSAEKINKIASALFATLGK